MAEERATECPLPEVTTLSSTEEHEHLAIDISHPRNKYTYEDGITVEILNSEGSNGARVFYSNTKEILCHLQGYDIDKYLVASNPRHTKPEQTEEALKLAITSLSPEGTLCLTNDGPLILVFKVAGSVRIHMMRSASHGYDDEFNKDFAEQYEGHNFADLYVPSEATSRYCHLFRQGGKTSAMQSPCDLSGRSMLYLGGVECKVHSPTPLVTSVTEVPSLILFISRLTQAEATEIICAPEHGLVCYRYPEGEVQFMSEHYIQRVATMTGVCIDELVNPISAAIEEEGSRIPPHDFRQRPACLEGKSSVKLNKSRFPRVVDLLSLYILCGTRSGRKTATISGFGVQLQDSGRILAVPKRGFYNFCRAAGVNPRKEIPFPATPGSMRLAIRRIILGVTLPKRVQEVEEEFDSYEAALSNLVPQLICRVMRGSAVLMAAFESAFGVSLMELMSMIPSSRMQNGSILRNIRSSLLLADHYRLVTITRFAVKYLAECEFTPLTMRQEELITILVNFSTSSRRRRMVSQNVAQSHQPEIDDLDVAEWPLPGGFE